MAIADIQQKLLDVLGELHGSLGDNDYAEAMEATKIGEPGVALEVICQQLFEYETRIQKRIYVRLEAIGQTMNMPDSTWKILEPLVTD